MMLSYFFYTDSIKYLYYCKFMLKEKYYYKTFSLEIILVEFRKKSINEHQY